MLLALSRFLSGTGKTIVDAARFLRDHLRRVEGGKPLGEAVADFLRAKRKEGVSERHLADLRHPVNPLLRGNYRTPPLRPT